MKLTLLALACLLQSNITFCLFTYLLCPSLCLPSLFSLCRQSDVQSELKKMDKAFSIARNAMGGHRNPYPNQHCHCTIDSHRRGGLIHFVGYFFLR